MARTKEEFLLSDIQLPTSTEKPKYLLLYELLRGLILTQRLLPGQKVPPSRDLATKLNISRSTVLLAYDHLATEGYLSGKTGSGTYVNKKLPEPLLETKELPSAQKSGIHGDLQISDRGKKLVDIAYKGYGSDPEIAAFQPGLPALESFPFSEWIRLSAKVQKQLPAHAYGYASPIGYLPLRKAIADYIRLSRAVRCEASQIIIVNGSQQAISLATQVLLDQGDEVWMEDPGYAGAKASLHGAGAKLVPIPIDKDGLDISYAQRVAPNARLAYVTASHQHPLGMLMPLSRRLALLQWADKHKSWILEDDYDSEYRYSGHPLSSLQGLDTHNRVIYMGTFSKTMFPSLRLGYLVVPASLVEAFAIAKSIQDRHCPIGIQAALTTFIEKGHFGRHIRRMRLLYEERKEMLVHYLKHYLDGYIRVQKKDHGMHLIGWLPTDISDEAFSIKSADKKLIARNLSLYSIQHVLNPGLVLGFTGFTESEIKIGTQTLLQIAETMPTQAS